MKKTFILFLSVILIVSLCPFSISANDDIFYEAATLESISASENYNTSQESSSIPSSSPVVDTETEAALPDAPSDTSDTQSDPSALYVNTFKIIVHIPDKGETIIPTTIRFNIFSEDNVWLGNRAVPVYTPGRYELTYNVNDYEIGSKFKIVATTGLSSYYYYGNTFNLNEECIIETFAYRDEYNQIQTCTEAYVVASVLTEQMTLKRTKEDFINSGSVSSDTDYLIWVSKENFTVNVFMVNNGRWELINEIPCSIGAPGTPTVTGVFKYHQYQTKWQYSGYYVGPIMRFYNGYAIHSTLINNNGSDRDNRVGKMISHGCVRVRPNDINWLVGYVPLGTTVYVTEF